VTVSSAGLGHGTGVHGAASVLMEEAAACQWTARVPRESAGAYWVIEDDIEAADSLRDRLAWGEYEVDVAYNGPEGLPRHGRFRPEVGW